MYNTNDLIKKIAEKDQYSFSVFYNLYSGQIKSIAFGILKDSQKAEDVVQEVMITVWQKSKFFIPYLDGERWVLKIAKNKAISCYRKTKNEKLVDFKDEKTNNSLNEFIDEFLSNFEDEVEIDVLLTENLTYNEKLVFCMKYNKYPTKNIAAFCGLSKRQVVYEYSKAINKLKEVIKKA